MIMPETQQAFPVLELVKWLVGKFVLKSWVMNSFIHLEKPCTICIVCMVGQMDMFGTLVNRFRCGLAIRLDPKERQSFFVRNRASY